MKSPFPGMDPYLELRWHDVHASLMVYARDQLNEQLPARLQSLVEESLAIQRHIEIVDTTSGGRVVTAIEVLSPANKVGAAGREAYIRKRREYFQAGVNLVEIDLLRQGEFILAVPHDHVPERAHAPYMICVRRAAYPRRVELYRAALREPLPNIRIPLRPTDSDAVLQLQPLIDECYRKGRHQKIDYRREPTPRFEREDAQWADQLLREQGFR